MMSSTTKANNTTTTTLLQVSDDKYTASIELSNACREFYRSRIKAAEISRKKLEDDTNKDGTCSISGGSNGTTPIRKKPSSIDVAMAQLRREMNSLMDQDLSLMKQLLILNEAIEDLKVQRGYLSSRGSLPSSSCDLSESQWSVSETEMFESENDLSNKYPTPSNLSLNLEQKCRITSDFEDLINQANEKMCFTKSIFEKKSSAGQPGSGIVGSTSSNTTTSNSNTNTSSNNNTTILITKSYFEGEFSKRAKHEEQNSFDSGIHEPHFDPEVSV